MKTAIYVIVLVFLFLYIADTTIEFKPFKISFTNLSAAFAMLFFWIALILMDYSVHSKAYEKGIKKGIEIEHQAAIDAAQELIDRHLSKK